MATIALSASPRAVFGKKSRFLRRAGITPANLYGADIESTPLQLDTKSLLKTIVHITRNTPVELHVEGEPKARTVFIWGAQRNPLTEEILHIDLFHVEATRTMRARVPILLDNVDPELEKFSKRVNQFINDVEVETLPLDLPEEFRVDVSSLRELDDDIRVAAIASGDKVTLLTAPDLVIAKVTEIVEHIEEPEGDLEAVLGDAEGDGEGAAEGDAGPAAGSSTEEAPSP